MLNYGYENGQRGEAKLGSMSRKCMYDKGIRVCISPMNGEEKLSWGA